MKKDIHGKYFQWVEVQCVCGNSFKVNAAVTWPIKLESCPACNTIYNKGIAIKTVIKGRMEKFLEKQDRIKKVQEQTK